MALMIGMMMTECCNIAVFASGNGTNCENIIRYFADNDKVNVVLVLSNRQDAYALVRAERLGIPTTVVSKADFNDEGFMTTLMRRYGIDVIVLAGFLWMIPSFLIQSYPHRMLNIHPSLLPKYGGKGMYGHHIHEAVKANNDTETGITIHFVSDVCDGGEIIFQTSVSVAPEDTPDDIAEKIHGLEKIHYPAIISKVIKEAL